jgi:hypothetical protein
MNNLTKIFLAIAGACSVLIEIMTPLAVALAWGYFFNLNQFVSTLILVIGGIATFFRAIKIGWMTK